MNEKVKVTISPVVAAYVRPGSSIETKLKGCDAAAEMRASDRLMLLFCLSRDPDVSVSSLAQTMFNQLPYEIVQDYIASSSSHPLIVNSLVHVYRTEDSAEMANSDRACNLNLSDEDENLATDEVEESIEPINENAPEFLSKYKAAQQMGIAEKIKMALSGDKEWRAILVKDGNKLVSGSVVKNPRISEAEVLALVKSGIQNDEIMRLICANREWVKNYKIRKALVENSRTPVQNAVRYLGTLNEKDLASLAKSKNVPTVVATTAKRLLLNKKG